MGTAPSSSTDLQAEREKEKLRRREEPLYPGLWIPESENGQRLFRLFLDEDGETEDETDEE